MLRSRFLKLHESAATPSGALDALSERDRRTFPIAVPRLHAFVDRSGLVMCCGRGLLLSMVRHESVADRMLSQPA